jgi:excisionase family DNA binding protein
MRANLELEDIQAIAERTVELLKTYLSSRVEYQQDIVFDVPGLCKYLQVTPRWVHERTHLKEIPHYKFSNKYLRFRKKDIDKWLESLKTPTLSQFTGKLKAVI